MDGIKFSHVTYILTRLIFSPVLNVALLAQKRTKIKQMGETLRILPDSTHVNINQGSRGETCAPYLDVLHHILCVGYLFHVSALDSFDTDSCQVDLAV